MPLDAEYYMAQILADTQSIVEQYPRFSREASNYGYTLAEQYLRELGYDAKPMKGTGEGLTGRVIARQLTDAPDVAQPPAPPDYNLDDYWNSELFAKIPQFYDLVKEQRDAYIAEFFPDCLDKLDVMCDWLENVIANGYSGLPAHIEDAIWNRDRARIDLEYRAASDEFVSEFAGRGFPLPAGPLAASLDKLNDARSKAVAVSSREAAVKQYEIAIETTKFAVKTAADLYINLHKVIDDVVKNATALILGAMDNTQKMAQAVVALYGMQVAYYSALESWHKLQLTNEIPQGTLDLKADEINVRTDLELMERHVRVALEKAQNMAQLVTSALSAQQTITTVNDNTERSGT